MKCKYNFEKVEIEDELMAVPLAGDGENFHGVLRLNETAEAILDLLKNDTTEEEVVEQLMKQYSGDKEKIAASVHRYIQKMIEAGVVEE